MLGKEREELLMTINFHLHVLFDLITNGSKYSLLRSIVCIGVCLFNAQISEMEGQNVICIDCCDFGFDQIHFNLILNAKFRALNFASMLALNGTKILCHP